MASFDPAKKGAHGQRHKHEGHGHENHDAQGGRKKAQHGDWGDRDFVRKQMHDKHQVNAWMLFEKAKSALRGDYDFAMEALDVNPANIMYVSEELKADKRIALKAITVWEPAFQYVAPALRADKEVVLAAVRGYHHSEVLQYALPTMQADPDVVMAAAKSNVNQLAHADKGLLADATFARQLFGSHGIDEYYRWKMWSFLDKSLWRDRDFVLDAVRSNGQTLELVDPSLQADREVVLIAVSNSGSNLHDGGGGNETLTPQLLHASVALRSDRDVVREAMKLNAQNLQYATDALKEDRDLVMEAVSHGFSLALLPAGSSYLLLDRELVLEAVKKTPSNYQYAHVSLRADKELTLVAVRGRGENLNYAAASLKADEEVVLAAMESDPLSAQCTTFEFLDQHPEIGRRLTEAQREYDRELERYYGFANMR